MTVSRNISKAVMFNGKLGFNAHPDVRPSIEIDGASESITKLNIALL
jgi:hypothetical protein